MEHQQLTKAKPEHQPQKKQQPSAQLASPARGSGQPLLHLQRHLGNEAFGRFIQAKLIVNQPGDMYEQEADRVAEQVMRMPEPVSHQSVSGISSGLQRKCAACASGGGTCPHCAEEEEMMQRKPLAAQITPLIQRQEMEEPEEEEEEILQAKEAPGATPAVSPAVESHISAMRGGGQPLPPSVRAFFEPRFGVDLRAVRVHTDARAVQLARAVDARAFTVGRDVVFGTGEYAPASSHGRKLLAHELTHVVQQGLGRATDHVNNRRAVLAAGLISNTCEAEPQWMAGVHNRVGSPIGRIHESVLQRDLRGQATNLVEILSRRVVSADEQRVAIVRIQISHTGEDLVWAFVPQEEPRFARPSGMIHTTEAVVAEGLRPLINMILMSGPGEYRITFPRDIERGGALGVPEFESLTDIRSAQVQRPLEQQQQSTQTEPGTEGQSILVEEEQAEGSEESAQSLVQQPEEGTYPEDVALFTAYLVRSGYIRQVQEIIPQSWRTMSEAELTEALNRTYTEEEIRRRYLRAYNVRQDIKSRFRKANIITAIVIGLLWARENIQEGHYIEAGIQVGSVTIGSYAMNRLLYARDLSAEELMRRKAGAFGRWFQGAARTNRFVNFVVRRLGGALAVWELRTLLMSGGLDSPNIPFDVIRTIDFHDPSTWVEPPQVLLDFGFDVWYRQTPEPNTHDVYLGYTEGSLTNSLSVYFGVGGITEIRSARGRLFRVSGYLESFAPGLGNISTLISGSANIIVLATGRAREESDLHGHYNMLEVRAVNDSALEEIGHRRPFWVRDRYLEPLETIFRRHGQEPSEAR